jgi:hypothetical protein
MLDNRPDPKPRKNPQLWQAYLIWKESLLTLNRHKTRMTAIERGKSNLDLEIEQIYLEQSSLKQVTINFEKMMKAYGATVGPIWNWLVSIRGIGDGLAAQLLALIDDIGKFDTVSKLWRFSGYAVIDGKREYPTKGKTLTYNKTLKSTVYLCGEQFVKHQSPLYVPIYYAEKERQRRLHPEPVSNGNGGKKYTDGHINYRAYRKMNKIFLQHLWLKWREYEDLPITMPYVHDVLNHVHYIEA